MRRGRLIALAALIALAGCGGMKVEDFEGREPRFRVEEYFVGKTKAWGIFQDRFGHLRRSFVVDIDGRWDGRSLTLVEDFIYSDGETEQRIWTIRPTGGSTYEGTAAGVVGSAQGEARGNALHWTYWFDLKVGESTWRVHFDDWMFLQDQEVMINRATVTKWGFEIGEATIFFRREAEDSGAASVDRKSGVGDAVAIAQDPNAGANSTAPALTGSEWPRTSAIK